jgi:predicted MFS family arabinose efflux permease
MEAFMVVSSSEAVLAKQGQAGVRQWLAVLAVAMGTFLVVTVENLPMGLLTGMASDLGVSAGSVGLMVTVSGLVAAVAAPVLPVAIRRLDRKTVLLTLVAMLIASSLISALTPNYPVLLGARVLAGISIGGFWSLAAGLAVRLVSPNYVPRAVSLVFFGAMVGTVLGIPATTLIGGFFGWRIAFMAVTVAAVVLVFALMALLPHLPAHEPVSVRTLVQQLRTPAVRTAVIATFLLVSGQYGAFTFVTPILQTISAVPAHAVGGLLLAYGVAAILGNFAAAWAVARSVRMTVVVLSAFLTAILATFPLIGTTPVMGAVLLMMWGFAFGALPVSLQTWIIKAAPRATEAATGLNTSVFNFAIALGALLGSFVVDSMALSGVMWIMAGLVAMTSMAVWSTREEDLT